ncbi:MAG: hypothetical protein CMJ78_00475 [Planctomycetaceae bacterium]|nr:hypothetical protein [Planctomycetaceae bacterium]
MQRRRINVNSQHSTRRGASSVDYVLVLAVLFPLLAFAIPTGKTLMTRAYEMMCTMVAWPFM